MLQSHELDRARERAWASARRVAELEDRCDRQRRTLQELAVASEALAKDNVALSNELVALRDSNEENERKVRELTARLSSAQRLYLAGQKSLERAEELREATAGGSELERKLDALLTPEMLARSRPPPSYPAPLALGPVDASSSSGVGGVGGGTTAFKAAAAAAAAASGSRVAHLRSAKSPRKTPSSGLGSKITSAASSSSAPRAGKRTAPSPSCEKRPRPARGGTTRSSPARCAGCSGWWSGKVGSRRSARKKTRTPNRSSGGC